MTDDRKTIVHIDPSEETGHYANAATIMHSPTEFIIDFIMLLPGDRRKVVSRIITSPSHLKQFAAAMVENIGKYEASYGEIPVPSKEPEFTGSVN